MGMTANVHHPLLGHFPRERLCQQDSSRLAPAMVLEVGVDAGYSGVPGLPRIPSVWVHMSVRLHEGV